MMKCRGCTKEYPKPDIIDGIAYFVCLNCGNVHEVENYRVYTVSERLEQFEKEYGYKLPNAYVEHSNIKGSRVFKLPLTDNDSINYYFGTGFYEVGKLAGLDPDISPSVFDSKYLVEAWDLPKELVLMDGDGHTWLALDYRNSKVEPKVIVIESNHSNSLTIAESFEVFINSLLPYEEVYDLDGNVIYSSEFT